MLQSTAYRARVGGDEFLILMPETGATGAARYISRVRAALGRVGLPEGLSLSLGAATPEEGETLTAVIVRADAAMYADKRRERGSSRPKSA
ncbi:MAG: diguanylate cyclase [Chloroflexi bacterium]|nr:MAG: diguanylate cyclase [Chloroflexota bacterium]